MGFRSESQRKGFYGNQAVHQDLSGRYAEDQKPIDQHLLKRFVGHAIKNKHSAEDRKFLKEQKDASEKNEKVEYAKALDKQREKAEHEKLLHQQLKKGEINPSDLEQFEPSGAEVLPEKFHEEQAKKYKEQLVKMQDENENRQKELVGRIEDTESNIVKIQREIEAKSREIHTLDLSPPQSDDPVQFIKYQHRQAEAKTKELQLKKEIEKLQEHQNELKEQKTQVSEKLDAVKKSAHDLSFASKSNDNLFGMAKGDQHEQTLDKGRIKAREDERERHHQQIHNPVSIMPSGTQHQRYDPRTHEYTNKLPTVFKGFNDEGKPIYETKPQSPKPTQEIKANEPEQEVEMPYSDEESNPRITVRLSRQ